MKSLQALIFASQLGFVADTLFVLIITPSTSLRSQIIMCHSMIRLKAVGNWATSEREVARALARALRDLHDLRAHFQLAVPDTSAKNHLNTLVLTSAVLGRCRTRREHATPPILLVGREREPMPRCAELTDSFSPPSTDYAGSAMSVLVAQR